MPAHRRCSRPCCRRRGPARPGAWRGSSCRPVTSRPPSSMATTAAQLLREELGVLSPRELLLPDDLDLDDVRSEGVELPAVTRRERWQFSLDAAQRALTEQLQTAGLSGFGLDGHPSAVGAAGALVQYLRDTQKGDLTHVRSLAYRETRDGLIIDATTLRHLEVLASTEGDRQTSLLGVLDDTVTSMGARLLRAWLTKPLIALDAIRDRLDAVEDLAFRSLERGQLRDTLKQVYDVQRLVATCRTRHGRAARSRRPRALAGGRPAAARSRSAALQAPLLAQLVGALDDLPDLRTRIATHPGRRPAAAGARRRRRPRRRRPRGRPPARPEPQRQERHLGDGGGRAPAHRHRLTEDPLQPRLRLLHRDLEVEPARGARRLHPQADDCRWRALRHAGLEDPRATGAARQRAPGDAGTGASSRPCGRTSPRRP